MTGRVILVHITSVWAVHQTLDLLRKIFPYRTCDRVITGQDPRACLYYDIKLCTAPCIGKINQEEYRQMIDDLCKFLEGHTDPILARLQRANGSSTPNQMDFEKAAVVRDQIQAIEKVVERQKIISNQRNEFGCHRACAQQWRFLCADLLHPQWAPDRAGVFHSGGHRR